MALIVVEGDIATYVATEESSMEEIAGSVNPGPEIGGTAPGPVPKDDAGGQRGGRCRRDGES
jgi:hypothetical protein